MISTFFYRGRLKFISQSMIKYISQIDKYLYTYIQGIADTLSIPKTVVRRIVTDELNMRKVCAKLVPKLLMDEQKANRISVSY
jgi:predicted ATP-dependent protease